MAKYTNRRIEANFRNPEFIDRLEEARFMVQQGKQDEAAAAHILKHMDLKNDENVRYPFLHIPDRQLAEMLGIGKSTVSKQRQRLYNERWGIKSGVKNVDTSKVRRIGHGDQFVYLYYYPTYREHARYYREKYGDDSYTTSIYRCNIGKTTGDVTNRVSQQMGQQLPEKPKIALIIKTDDCAALETKIHDELKRRGCWLDPNSGDDVVGVEWFLTNPTEVEGIVKAIHSTNGENLKKETGIPPKPKGSVFLPEEIDENNS